jgi:hypothetical protein
MSFVKDRQRIRRALNLFAEAAHSASVLIVHSYATLDIQRPSGAHVATHTATNATTLVYQDVLLFVFHNILYLLLEWVSRIQITPLGDFLCFIIDNFPEFVRLKNVDSQPPFKTPILLLFTDELATDMLC